MANETFSGFNHSFPTTDTHTSDKKGGSSKNKKKLVATNPHDISTMESKLRRLDERLKLPLIDLSEIFSSLEELPIDGRVNNIMPILREIPPAEFENKDYEIISVSTDSSQDPPDVPQKPSAIKPLDPSIGGSNHDMNEDSIKQLRQYEFVLANTLGEKGYPPEVVMEQILRQCFETLERKLASDTIEKGIYRIHRCVKSKRRGGTTRHEYRDGEETTKIEGTHEKYAKKTSGVEKTKTISSVARRSGLVEPGEFGKMRTSGSKYPYEDVNEPFTKTSSTKNQNLKNSHNTKGEERISNKFGGRKNSEIFSKRTQRGSPGKKIESKKTNRNIKMREKASDFEKPPLETGSVISQRKGAVSSRVTSDPERNFNEEKPNLTITKCFCNYEKERSIKNELEPGDDSSIQMNNEWSKDEIRGALSIRTPRNYPETVEKQSQYSQEWSGGIVERVSGKNTQTDMYPEILVKLLCSAERLQTAGKIESKVAATAVSIPM
ncbi:hypothetical protein JTB14_029275 [Gonioctena quinquepunctata]|nr:hypothetical protein JTB14_029275 [Gonioctena quinquepunctata]